MMTTTTAIPPTQNCTNTMSVDDCKDELKDNFSGNIYEMCCDDDMATNCCAFCKRRLTCDAENNIKRDIIGKILFSYNNFQIFNVGLKRFQNFRIIVITLKFLNKCPVLFPLKFNMIPHN